MPDDYEHIDIAKKHESTLSKGADGSASLTEYFSVISAISIKEVETVIKAYEPPEEIKRKNKVDALWFGTKTSLDIDVKYFNGEAPENNLFEVTKTWTSKQTENEDEDTIDWIIDISSQTVSLTTALSAVMADGSYKFWNPEDYQPGGTKADRKPGEGSPINVYKQNGKIEIGGVDIAVPSYKITIGFECEKKKWKKLRPIIIRNAATINSDVFQGFEPGELLFSSFSAERLNEDSYKLNYTFYVSSAEDYVAGDFVITKDKLSGFDAKWAFFGSEKEIEEGEGENKIKRIVPVCTGAYASAVYRRTEFAN